MALQPQGLQIDPYMYMFLKTTSKNKVGRPNSIFEKMLLSGATDQKVPKIDKNCQIYTFWTLLTAF